jgi:regulator of sirC expression with transglutaminase-like and TPR domain
LDLTPVDQRELARSRFAELVAGDAPFDLVEAALWVAAEEYPGLVIERELERIHLLSAEGARRVYSLRNPFARLDSLRSYLFEELKFGGNADDYNNPLNCYLNEVLNRRLGIPLTLSLLFMEVARAAGFEPRGIGLPGHFITGVTFEGRSILVDPYHAGRVITEEDCRQLVGRTTGRPSLFRREMLVGSDDRSIMARLLLNLKHMYVECKDYARAVSVVDRLLLLTPDDMTEIRDRGFLQAHLGEPAKAIHDLETYLTRSPSAADARSVRGRVSWLRRKLSDLN